MKKLFLLLALLGMVATGCSKDEGGNIPDDAYISLNKEIVTISPDGESVGVKVYSNYSWELTNNCDWITTSITSGDASDTGVIVTLTADLTYDDRDGTIVFSCGKAKKLLVVSQKLKEAIIPDAKNTFNIPAEGGVAVITYQTTVDCEVIIPEEAQSWITIEPATRGLSTYSTTLNIAENNLGKGRNCMVKVVSKDNNKLSAEYTIIQNSRYCLYYTSSNGEIVTPYNSSVFGATIISNTYIDGIGVIEFNAPITMVGGRAFYNCYSLTSVTIPDSATTIESSAFEDCRSLTSVTIPDSVTTIVSSAFEDCSGLTSITIPDSVTTIGSSAFEDCSGLTSVYISDIAAWCNISFGNSYSNPLYYACNLYLNNELVTDLTIPDSVTTIGNGTFAWCSSLTSVTIPDSVTTIGSSAFEGCSSLTSVTIPDSVTTIGSSAFEDCSSLTSITIPDSVTTIGDYAFWDCSNLTSVYISDIAAWCNISFSYSNSNPLYYARNLYLNNELVTDLTIPDSITTIGNSAFYNCDSLTSVTIPDSVTTIGNSAFYNCDSLTSVTIPDSVTTIGDSAFRGCSSLTSITIPDSVTTIGNYAFAYCRSLTSVTIGDSVTTIGEGAFEGCSSLTSVTIPDSVTTIGSSAFEDCSSLTSITIPDSVTTIGNGAFAWCSSLTSVYCKSITPPIADGVHFGMWDTFDNNPSSRKIYVPAESVEAYKSAEGWSEYADAIEGYNF